MGVGRHCLVGRVRELLPFALLAAACGPSFQAVYECDVHFEHCYALEEKAASAALKRQCWREWVDGYTFGQSRDRIEYATKRYAALASDSRPSLDVSSASSETLADHAGGPSPTSAFAPPPNIASAQPPAPAASSAASAAAPEKSPPRAPGADCGDACTQRWTSCSVACKGVACPLCDQAYRACMPRCFR
jgi:hypothetical protein